MANVSETIVREYFELHGFLTRQERKFVARLTKAQDGIDFFVWNPRPVAELEPRPFILTGAHLHSLRRAVVVVRGWHTESFGPGVLENSPEIFRFLDPAVLAQAARAFGGGEPPPLKILVVPALAQTESVREEGIKVLRGKGVDGVIAFRTILAELITQTEVNRNYEKSDLLQIIRVLKNYDLFKDPQLELFRSPRRPRRRLK